MDKVNRWRFRPVHPCDVWPLNAITVIPWRMQTVDDPFRIKAVYLSHTGSPTYPSLHKQTPGYTFRKSVHHTVQRI